MTSVVIEKSQEQANPNAQVIPKLTLDEFLSLPENDESYELVDGEAIKKVSPKFFHSSLTTVFWVDLSAWSDGIGSVRVEWSVVLKRRGQDWVPVPDLLYVSYDRLASDWREDAPCPVLPELVIEIVSPDQTFNQLAQKATDYLSAGVDRVWVVYPPMRSITVFFGDRPPETYRGDRLLTDELFPDLAVTSEQFFVKAGI
ncbi:Uma2 family endonuclease [Pseudanabaena sp. Chao 1811]|uniref:Uma2 family endonuclease n=1 Tax=Pseudanabaena sp. Chao 1811 TaxID=2963092 RepID=UPI0022F3DE0E|nr:Uma2 family endonuclease [Pseudanabaena sp. Chao 1811]